MIRTIVEGRSASAALADTFHVKLKVVDVGSYAPPLETSERYRDRRHMRGTRDLSKEPALSYADFLRAENSGRAEATDAIARGAKICATGEMGIGNTTSAACLAMLLADVPIEFAVGPGAGTNAAVFEAKRNAVAIAVERAHKLREKQGIGEAIASVAGLEIAAMAGFLLQCSIEKTPCVLDGYIAGTAALIARALHPKVEQTWIAAHRSAEPGHAMVLKQLGLEPFLEWEMRLGEGTGAILLMPMLDAAAAIVGKMATLESVVGK
jgi:nicotinate-nucleotide--dimethylbenzimidazole phosphoribosyltransferase